MEQKQVRTHVHFHVVARYADQPADKRGPRIFDYLGVSHALRVSDQAMTDLAVKVRAMLQAEK